MIPIAEVLRPDGQPKNYEHNHDVRTYVDVYILICIINVVCLLAFSVAAKTIRSLSSAPSKVKTIPGRLPIFECETFPRAGCEHNNSIRIRLEEVNWRTCMARIWQNSECLCFGGFLRMSSLRDTRRHYPQAKMQYPGFTSSPISRVSRGC